MCIAKEKNDTSENKLPPTKITQKFTPSFFTLLNFNEIGCKQYNENDQMASFFCYFQILYMKSAKNYFPRSLKNTTSAKLNSHKNLRFQEISNFVQIYRAI